MDAAAREAEFAGEHIVVVQAGEFARAEVEAELVRLDVTVGKTAGDLEYLINFRKQIQEITGVEHSDQCRAETRALRALVNAMKAEGARSVGDLDQTGTLQDYWPTEDE